MDQPPKPPPLRDSVPPESEEDNAATKVTELPADFMDLGPPPEPFVDATPPPAATPRPSSARPAARPDARHRAPQAHVMQAPRPAIPRTGTPLTPPVPMAPPASRTFLGVGGAVPQRHPAFPPAVEGMRDQETTTGSIKVRPANRPPSEDDSIDTSGETALNRLPAEIAAGLAQTAAASAGPPPGTPPMGIPSAQPGQFPPFVPASAHGPASPSSLGLTPRAVVTPPQQPSYPMAPPQPIVMPVEGSSSSGIVWAIGGILVGLLLVGLIVTGLYLLLGRP